MRPIGFWPMNNYHGLSDIAKILPEWNMINKSVTLATNPTEETEAFFSFDGKTFVHYMSEFFPVTFTQSI